MYVCLCVVKSVGYILLDMTYKHTHTHMHNRTRGASLSGRGALCYYAAQMLGCTDVKLHAGFDALCTRKQRMQRHGVVIAAADVHARAISVPQSEGHTKKQVNGCAFWLWLLLTKRFDASCCFGDELNSTCSRTPQ